MKTSFTILIFLLFFSTQAQYNINWAEAPLNKIPLKYKLEHFNLKGPVKLYQISVSSNYFDKEGYLLYGKQGPQFEFTYDANHKPLTHSSWLSDSYRPIYSLDVDSNNRIIGRKYENKKRYDEQYTYDTKGNWTGTKDEYGNQKSTTYIYTYDSKNRVIKAEYFSQKILWEDTFSYTKEGVFVVVTTSRIYTEDTSKNFILTHYYKNGVFYGENKNDHIKFDKYGNVSMEVSAGYSSYKYEYYGDVGVSDDVMENSPAPIKVANADPQCTVGNCTDGFGNYNYDNGNYVGFFENGKKEGYGIYTWKSGDSYRGMWANDEMTGYSQLDFKAGGSQSGIFKNGKLNGLGVTIFSNKTAEYGEYTDGKLTAKYNYYSNNKDKGCFAGDCFKGYGKFIYDNGTQFIGFFKNGYMHQGVWFGPNGISYSGQFAAENKLSGIGNYTYGNRDSYVGQFVNGKKEGKGWFMYVKDNKYITGEWKDDKIFKVYLKN